MDEADAWWRLEQRLAAFVTALHDGEALILSDRDNPARYVQVLSFGTDGTVAEVAAGAAPENLVDCGWRVPKRRRRWGQQEGSPNYTMETAAGEGQRLAAMLVAVLRDDWRLPGPGALAAEKLNDAGGPPLDDLGSSLQL